MAILSKIRQRSILLVLIIALALFSFVLADVIKSGGFSGGSNNIGSINGTKFEYQEFMGKVANVEKQQQGIIVGGMWSEKGKYEWLECEVSQEEPELNKLVQKRMLKRHLTKEEENKFRSLVPGDKVEKRPQP